jgi:hypothetical protein
MFAARLGQYFGAELRICFGFFLNHTLTSGKIAGCFFCGSSLRAVDTGGNLSRQ